MAEAFVCICSLLGLSFNNDTPRVDKCNIQVYPLFVLDQEDEVSFGKIHQAVLVDLELDTFNLQVDCPSGSFIVNNLVVKGEGEGAGAPSDSSVPSGADLAAEVEKLEVKSEKLGEGDNVTEN